MIFWLCIYFTYICVLLNVFNVCFFSAVANEIMVRDSIDVERKIYSSTPDQTMLVVQPLTNTFIDDEDLSHYTNYEDDDDADENTIELETIHR